jgi:hypothetical protein
MYTNEGRALMEEVWSETLKELKIDDIKKTLASAAL